MRRFSFRIKQVQLLKIGRQHLLLFRLLSPAVYLNTTTFSPYPHIDQIGVTSGSMESGGMDGAWPRHKGKLKIGRRTSGPPCAPRSLQHAFSASGTC